MKLKAIYPIPGMSLPSIVPLLKQEAVLITSLLCAVLSMFFVPPSMSYVQYIDFRVLSLLFCLMIVVAGVQRCGLFELMAQKLLTGRKSFRLLCFVLVLMPFFSSMLITNDVALITFVPFAIIVLNMIDRPGSLIYVITLQTLAANLGSMATPLGNPQNLFLFSRYQITLWDFLSVMLPYTLLSLAFLALAVIPVKNDRIEVEFPAPRSLNHPGLMLLLGVLFLLCLLSVLHILHYGIVLGLVLAALLLCARDLFRLADYSLLLTFVFFFICAGNIAHIPQLQQFLSGVMDKSTILSSIAASQLISNVPAAVLLYGFTDHWKQLLIGVNIGGLGTLIASLASLISFKFYVKTRNASPLRYLRVFTQANLLGLLVLVSAAFIWGHW